MKMPYRRPAFTVALRFLSDFMARQEAGAKFPPVQRLADMAGVSYVTMFNAVRHVKERSTEDHRRSEIGLESAGASAYGKNPARSPRPWQRVAGRIDDDIRNGAYPAGKSLPSMKELGLRYRVTYKTLRRALIQQAERGSISQATNGVYSVPGFSSNVRRSRIVCITQSSDSLAMAFGQHDEVVFRELESQCEMARINIDVHLAIFDHELGIHRIRHKASGRIRDAADMREIDDASVLGYVCLLPWEPGPALQDAIVELARLKKPTLIMDETSLLELPPQTRRASWVRVFSVSAAPESAHAVADHLLALGHRTVAFLSLDNEAAWSQRRLEGLTSAFARKDGTVIPLVTHVELNVFEHGSQRCDFAPYDRFYAAWRTQAPPEYQVELDRIVERLHIDGCQRAEFRRALLPLLEQALAMPDVTAWIAANDAVASMAMAYSKERGVAVPARLSLISFDDSIDALRNNFTSYNFNAHAFAGFIVGTILGRKPYAERGVEVEGFIVDRGSTGRARRAS